MNPQSFTYSGVTVSYTEQQKAIVLADQNLITQLKEQYASYQQQYNDAEAAINIAKNELDNHCNNLSGSVRQNCINTNNAIWDSQRAIQANLINYMNTNTAQQASAVKKLNDDIATIENDIKIQIQTQLANSAAAASAANAQTTVNTAPAVVAANAAAVQAQLANEAAAAKLKSDQNTKIAEFVIVAIVIIAIGFFIIRKAI